MAMFLVGWELGGERGHVALLEPVVEALLRRGHDVAVAVKDLSALSAHSSVLDGRVFQAPAWPPPAPERAGPASQTLADDLAAVGLCNEEGLHVRARTWGDLIDLLGADVVLAESAPTLLLAARSRCPAVAFGSGYSVPPAGRALPAVLDNHRHPDVGNAANEEALRRAFDGVDRSLGGEGLAWFGDLFSVPTWVCNLTELDPYAALRSAPAPGPLLIRQIDEVALNTRKGFALAEKVFVYAKPFPVLPALMEGLARRCRQLEVFIPNMPAIVDNPWPHVTLHRAPIDIPRRLPEFSAVVHFGGLNLAAEALFAGIPQLVLPQHLEQAATALAVQRLGAGHCQLNIPREPERESERLALVNELADRFFADVTLPGRAAEFGAQLRTRQEPSLPGLVGLCEEVLKRGGKPYSAALGDENMIPG